MEYKCPYCGRIFTCDHSHFMYHVNRCKQNPNRIYKPSKNAIFINKSNLMEIINKSSFKLFKPLEDKEYRLGDKIQLICQEHGIFDCFVNNIIKNNIKCPICSDKKVGKERRISKEEWLKRFKEVHGDKYDYSKSDFSDKLYNENHGKICIIYPGYGEFWQSPKNHAGGAGWNMTWDDSNKCKELFIKFANEVYDSKIKYVAGVHNYSYQKTNIKDYKTDIIVTCSLHGDFIAGIKGFLGGHGCKECSRINRNASHTYTTEKWISKLKEIHGDKYDYSKVSLDEIKETGKCTLICPIHGEFKTNPGKQNGCPYCATNTTIGKEYRNKQIIKILEDKDIEKMPGWLIKVLISVGKYPKEFYKIINTKPNSEERKEIIADIRKNAKNNISEEQYIDIDNYIPGNNDYNNEGYDSEDVIDILNNIGHKLNTDEEISMILDKTPFIIEFFKKDLQNNHDKSEGYGTSNLYYIEVKKKFDEGKLTKFENIVYQSYIDDCIELDNLRKIA